MSRLLFTNYNKYLATHEAFRLDTLKKWGDEFGFNVFVQVLDDVDITPGDYPGFYFTQIKPTHIAIREEIKIALAKYKPTMVINFLEKFFPFDLVETDAEKIYFVRSCAAKLMQVLLEYKSDTDLYSNAIAKYQTLCDREERIIRLSNRLITTSPTSRDVLHDIYHRDSEICIEYINPTKYNTVSYGHCTDTVFNIGRRDFQKGLHLIRPANSAKVISIGAAEVGVDDCSRQDIIKYPVLDFTKYSPIVQDLVYGIYPSIWESNGYAVQECLAMGKIPIIQVGSGGNERLCTPQNSFSVDLCHGADWEGIILGNTEYRNMQLAARETITYKMHRDSLEKFAEILHT